MTIDMMLIAQRSALIFELNKENCFFLKLSFYICRKYKILLQKRQGRKKMRQTYYGSDWLLMKTKEKKKSRRINEKNKKLLVFTL